MSVKKSFNDDSWLITANGITDVVIRKNKNGISSLLVLRFKKPANPSYCLKNKPDKMKYNGILNDANCVCSG